MQKTDGPVAQLDTCLPAGRECQIPYKMQYTVYAIISEKDGRIYVGFSKNVRDRIKQHNQGTTKSTKAYRPWTLLFEKAVSSRQEARRLEKYYKSGCGKEYLKLLARPRSSTG